MNTADIISLIAMVLLAGGVTSRLVELIKGASWHSHTKWLLSVGLSAAVGLATAWLAGDVVGLATSWGSLSVPQAFAFIGSVYATANGFYVLWFKPRAVAKGSTSAA